MNRNIFKVAFLVSLMVMNGIVFGMFTEKLTQSQLENFEKQIYPNISYVKVVTNIFRLDQYVKSITATLNAVAFQDFKIDKSNPLYARRQAIASFFSTDQDVQDQVMKSACVAKIRNIVLATIAIVGGPFGYYFYSKNK